MTSLLTNSSAITALQNLNATNKSMQTTQDRISTGMRVANASDNAAYWAIATTMRSDNSALSTVRDALGIGSATVDVAASALKTTADLTSQIRTKLVAASQPGIDRAKVQSEIKQLQDQIQSVADSSTFSGQNWLAVDTTAATYVPTKSMVASFNRNGTTVSIGTIDLTLSSFSLFDTGAQTGLIDKSRTSGTTTASVSTIDISALTDSTADLATLDDYVQIVEDAHLDLVSGASTLGVTKTRIQDQSMFVSSLIDSVTKGIGQLVDADMNTESTRLQALQVQQQLGVQSLSIANQSSQQILSLFRG